MKIRLFDNDGSTAILLPMEQASAAEKSLLADGLSIWGIFSSLENPNDVIIVVKDPILKVKNAIGI